MQLALQGLVTIAVLFALGQCTVNVPTGEEAWEHAGQADAPKAVYVDEGGAPAELRTATSGPELGLPGDAWPLDA
ncbi:MAG TPA: hypothetical protein PKK06_00860 [Phycisphaerae bacterium]|nr:hypothetical protein [Phycisphaerae bacterium]HNU43841.1 hypothetical protein [Phycisphaerae bacterium]